MALRTWVALRRQKRRRASAGGGTGAQGSAVVVVGQGEAEGILDQGGEVLVGQGGGGM